MEHVTGQPEVTVPPQSLELDPLFMSLATTEPYPWLRGINATCRCDIRNAGNWLVIISDGSVSVTRSSYKADCVFTCDAPVMERILTGKLNPLAAGLQGLVTIEGDMAVAQRCVNLIRARTGAAAPVVGGATHG